MFIPKKFKYYTLTMNNPPFGGEQLLARKFEE